MKIKDKKLNKIEKKRLKRLAGYYAQIDKINRAYTQKLIRRLGELDHGKI